MKLFNSKISQTSQKLLELFADLDFYKSFTECKNQEDEYALVQSKMKLEFEDFLANKENIAEYLKTHKVDFLSVEEIDQVVGGAGREEIQKLMDSLDEEDYRKTTYIMMRSKLQLAQSEMHKNAANDIMDKITEKQELQREITDMISHARGLQSEEDSAMPQDMVNFYKTNNINYDMSNNDNLHSAEEWDNNIHALKEHQETVARSTQDDMVLLSDYMTQYNSCLEDANKLMNEYVQSARPLSDINA